MTITLILALPNQFAAVVNNERPTSIVEALFEKRHFNTIMFFVERARNSRRLKQLTSLMAKELDKLFLLKIK